MSLLIHSNNRLLFAAVAIDWQNSHPMKASTRAMGVAKYPSVKLESCNGAELPERSGLVREGDALESLLPS